MASQKKLKKLSWELEEVEKFDKPKILLEQYVTSANIAADMIFTMETNFGDISDRLVADLGCGCGVLSVAALKLGAAGVIGFDVDPDALEICQKNISEVAEDAEGFSDLVLFDVGKEGDVPEGRFSKAFDTVMMNPPFGTKHNAGIDMKFVKVGLGMARRAVYSLHKSSTREHVLKKAKGWGAEAKVLAQVRYELPATYKHHKKNSVDIEVDFVRFSLGGKD